MTLFAVLSGRRTSSRQADAAGTAATPLSSTEVHSAKPRFRRTRTASATPKNTSPGNHKLRSILSVYAHLRDAGYVKSRHFVALAVCSVVGGLLEAGLLFILIQAALALSSNETELLVQQGPFDVIISLPHALAAAALMLVISAILGWGTAAISARMATSVIDSVRRDTSSAFLDARWELQSREEPATVQEHLSTHVTKMGSGATILGTATAAAANLIAYVGSAFFISITSALLMVAGGILFGVGILPLTRLTRRRSRELLRLNSDYSRAVSYAVALSRDARVNNVTGTVHDNLVRLSAEQAKSGYSTRLLGKLTPLLYQKTALAILLVSLLVAYAASSADLAALGAIVVLLVRAITYGQQLNTAVQQSGEIVPYLQTLAEALHRYKSAPATGGDTHLEAVRSLELLDVAVSYDSEFDVLKGISFTADSGEMIAIVGPSGSGKSTLSQAILRLRQPNSGRILVNGLSLDSYSLTSWFDSVAFVPQDNYILPGTVADNIRFYRDFSDAEITEVARMSNIHDDIMSWPRQYDTIIGPGGADVSGGQRQRLGLARALAGSPTMIVLDEPTSALDLRSEALIQTTLRALKGKIMSFIIAHRLSTIAACDRVLVIEGGTLTAIGTPDEVEANNGFFGEAAHLSRGGRLGQS